MQREPFKDERPRSLRELARYLAIPDRDRNFEPAVRAVEVRWIVIPKEDRDRDTEKRLITGMISIYVVPPRGRSATSAGWRTRILRANTACRPLHTPTCRTALGYGEQSQLPDRRPGFGERDVARVGAR